MEQAQLNQRLAEKENEVQHLSHMVVQLEEEAKAR